MLYALKFQSCVPLTVAFNEENHIRVNNAHLPKSGPNRHFINCVTKFVT